MLSPFIQEKMAKAKFRKLEDGTYFGTISGVKGVWANKPTKDACKKELQSALESWIMFSLRMGDRIPGLRVPNLKPMAMKTAARTYDKARSLA